MGAGFRMVAKGTEAEIYIYEDVGGGFFGGVSAKQFATDLKALGNVDTIHVHINSYGGEVMDGLAIYRQLVDHKARVVVHIDGVAASIASVIAMAGDEILISEAGFIMIHNASGVVFGESVDMRKMADLLDTVTGTITDVYASRTEQERDAIVDWMNEERWFTAAEAVELLFADSMVENLRVAAHVDMKRHTFKHVPQALLTAEKSTPVQISEFDRAALTPARPTAQSPLAARVALQAAQLAARKTSAA